MDEIFGMIRQYQQHEEARRRALRRRVVVVVTTLLILALVGWLIASLIPVQAKANNEIRLRSSESGFITKAIAPARDEQEKKKIKISGASAPFTVNVLPAEQPKMEQPPAQQPEPVKPKPTPKKSTPKKAVTIKNSKSGGGGNAIDVTVWVEGSEPFVNVHVADEAAKAKDINLNITVLKEEGSKYEENVNSFSNVVR